MKKWLIAIMGLLLILVASVYLLIPGMIQIEQGISIKANRKGLHRNLFDENAWQKWWPGESIWDKDSQHYYFTYDDYRYKIETRAITALPVSVARENFRAASLLNLVEIANDSVRLIWGGKIATSNNPLLRLQVYLHSQKLNQNMKTIIEKMQSYFSKPENVYGCDIKKATVVDTALVSTFAISKGYPGTGFIYGLIDKLKNYINSQGAKETGFPMLNISTTDSLNFLTKVAIPTDRALSSSGNISYKWMLGGGDILITEVKGGPVNINKTFRQIENYVTDHRHTIPAIHFQSLVTDRRQQPDTSKWITRIYYPVI